MRQTRALTAEEQSIILAALVSYRDRWARQSPAYAKAATRLLSLVQPGATLTVRMLRYDDDLPIEQSQSGKVTA